MTCCDDRVIYQITTVSESNNGIVIYVSFTKPVT